MVLGDGDWNDGGSGREGLVCQSEKMYWKGRGRRRVNRVLWREEDRRGREGRGGTAVVVELGCSVEGRLWCGCDAGGVVRAIDVDIVVTVGG